MAVTSGNVNITVRVDGVGTAPAKVKETKTEVDKLNESSKKAGASATSLKDRMGALKSAAGPVNVVREAFENLKSNMGLVGLAVGGVLSVLGTLYELLDTPRIDSTVEKFNRLTASVNESTGALAGLVAEAAKLRGSLAGVDSEIAEIDAEVAERQGRWEDAAAARERAGMIRVDDRIKADEEKLAESDKAANQAEGLVRKAREQKREVDAEAYHLEQMIAMRAAQGLATQKQVEQLAAVRVAQATVIVNLEMAETAYDGAARAADGYARKLVALDAKRASLDEPAVAKPKKPTGGGGNAKENAKRYRDAWMQDPAFVSPDFVPPIVPDLGRDDAHFGRALKVDDQDKAQKATLASMRKRGMADEIRDFSASLSEALPGMQEFSGALGVISSSWADVAAANDNAADVYEKFLDKKATESELLKATKDARTAEVRGIIASVGAGAMAAAESIKNERLRAGILATIHLGLGTALMFVPGAQQEAIGHLAGAAILGSVAIFGGSKSGGGSISGRSSRAVGRSLSDQGGAGGAWTFNIFGGWFGTASPQETAASLYQLTRRGGGSGYVPMRGAA